MRCAMGMGASAILVYAVGLGESANESQQCSLMNQLQALDQNLREDSLAIVKAAQHKRMNEVDHSFESPGAGNDAELPQLVVTAAAAHMIYMRRKGDELWIQEHPGSCTIKETSKE